MNLYNEELEENFGSSRLPYMFEREDGTHIGVVFSGANFENTMTSMLSEEFNPDDVVSVTESIHAVKGGFEMQISFTYEGETFDETLSIYRTWIYGADLPQDEFSLGVISRMDKILSVTNDTEADLDDIINSVRFTAELQKGEAMKGGA